MHGNDCPDGTDSYCWDRASSSDWLFGLWPGPPQRFQPKGTGTYQSVHTDAWPAWGIEADLEIGSSGAPGGSDGDCEQGTYRDGSQATYRGAIDESCGGYHNWGATDVEVWYPQVW